MNEILFGTRILLRVGVVASLQTAVKLQPANNLFKHQCSPNCVRAFTFLFSFGPTPASALSEPIPTCPASSRQEPRPKQSAQTTQRRVCRGKRWEVIKPSVHTGAELVSVFEMDPDLSSLWEQVNPSGGFLCYILWTYKSRISTKQSSSVQFGSVRYTLERLFLHFHCETLWLVPKVPLHIVPFFHHPSAEVPRTLTWY